MCAAREFLFCRAHSARYAGYPISTGRRAYLHVARGSLQVNGHGLNAGDALMYVNEERVSLAAKNESEVLLFDLA